MRSDGVPVPAPVGVASARPPRRTVGSASGRRRPHFEPAYYEAAGGIAAEDVAMDPGDLRCVQGERAAALEAPSTAAGPLSTGIDAVPDAVPAVGAPAVRLGLFLVGFGVVFLVGWFLLEPALSRVIGRRNRNNPTLEEAITRYVRLVVLVVGVFVGTAAAGFTGLINDSALVIAAATLGLGIAGQSVIGSLVSGTALVVDPQFNVGNYVRWSGGEGRVTSITLRVTRVRTPDGGLVTVPNTTLTNESVERPFEGDDVRVVERVGVAYAADADRATALLDEVVRGVDGVRADPPPRVGVEELDGDEVVLRAEYWIDDPVPGRLSVGSAVKTRIKDRFQAAGIEISPAAGRDIGGEIRVDGLDHEDEAEN